MKRLPSTKDWDVAPEELTTQDYAELMGVHVVTARKRFKEPGFPKVREGKVNKKDLMKYLGIETNSNSESISYTLLLEIKKELTELKVEMQRKSEFLKQVV